MERCPRCGNILKDGFCDGCGYPIGWKMRLSFVEVKMR